jgi:hypothetical protein
MNLKLIKKPLFKYLMSLLELLKLMLNNSGFSSLLKEEENHLQLMIIKSF